MGKLVKFETPCSSKSDDDIEMDGLNEGQICDATQKINDISKVSNY